ncbi:uncharacterized protein LOC133205853 [Saccostrea echinata]|uniref:uncharacterized protein LOC133205853 n=1 Tax=Saccostrea echinata TaxID=191078 RepID=UPI002A836AF3|nr:uncharacterized protein LOC133205853 [Saccostrea echinata]
MFMRMYVPCVRGYKKNAWTFNKRFFSDIGLVCVTVTTLLCVVFLHYKLSTSHGTEDQQNFLPTLHRRIRSVGQTEHSGDFRKFATEKLLPFWLQHYCYGHQPNQITTGPIPDGFSLEQVHILLTPGITSSENIPNCVKVPESRHYLAQVHHLKNTALHKIFQNVPITNSSIHCKKGELHPLAHHQLHELGKQYFSLYMEKWNIEASHVAPKHFRIHSLDKKDSLSSLISFLHGMLPQKHFKNVNIQMLDAITKVSKRKDIKLECNFQPNLTDYLDQHFMKHTQADSGTGHFYSNVLPNICSSFSQKSRNKTAENIVQNSLLLMDKGMKSCSGHHGCQQLTDLHTFPWLQEFFKNVQMIRDVFEKVFIYAVDRAFISYLMSSFRYRNVKVTHPGSHVAIEIYRNIYEKVNPYYVKILYNGINISHQVPLCTKTYPWSLCKLKYFVDFQKQKYKSLFKSSPMVHKSCHFSVI